MAYCFKMQTPPLQITSSSLFLQRIRICVKIRYILLFAWQFHNLQYLIWYVISRRRYSISCNGYKCGFSVFTRHKTTAVYLVVHKSRIFSVRIFLSISNFGTRFLAHQRTDFDKVSKYLLYIPSSKNCFFIFLIKGFFHVLQATKKSTVSFLWNAFAKYAIKMKQSHKSKIWKTRF